MTNKEAKEKLYMEWQKFLENNIDYAGISEAYQIAFKALEQEPNTGRWISHREYCEMNNLRPSGLGSYFWCSECDCGIDVKEWHRNNYNYCPNCGAKMEVKENDT